LTPPVAAPALFTRAEPLLNPGFDPAPVEPEALLPASAPPGAVFVPVLKPGTTPGVVPGAAPRPPLARASSSSRSEPLPAPAGGMVTGVPVVPPAALGALPSPPSGAVRPLPLPVVLEVLEGDWKAK